MQEAIPDFVRRPKNRLCPILPLEPVGGLGCPHQMSRELARPPNLDLSRFVNNLKTTSSRLLRKEFADRLKRVYRKPVFWSRSYRIITCGGAPLSILKPYIEQQRSPE